MNLTSAERFVGIYICEDCNNADAAAKAICGAPEYFTFTPNEIAEIIKGDVLQNMPHKIIYPSRVEKIYATSAWPNIKKIITEAKINLPLQTESA